MNNYINIYTVAAASVVWFVLAITMLEKSQIERLRERGFRGLLVMGIVGGPITMVLYFIGIPVLAIFVIAYVLLKRLVQTIVRWAIK